MPEAPRRHHCHELLDRVGFLTGHDLARHHLRHGPRQAARARLGQGADDVALGDDARHLAPRADNGPGISTVMVQAFNIVQDRIARSRLAGDPPDIMISPRLPAVGLFDFHRAEDMIECGLIAARRELDDIRREIISRRFTAELARTA